MRRSALNNHVLAIPGVLRRWPSYSAILLCMSGFVLSSPSLGQNLTFADLVVSPASNEDIKSFNVYHADSFEPLIDLGLQMQEQDRHEEAIDYFKQARQVSRIQNGLYDETQILLVEAIIESEMALQNWKEVDDHYQYAEYLYHRLYDLEDPELERGLDKVSRWLSYFVMTKPVGDRIDLLYRAKKVYSLRLQIAQQTLAADHPKLAYLQENITICDTQLFPVLSPSRDDESDRSRQQRRRVPLAANF